MNYPDDTSLPTCTRMFDTCTLLFDLHTDFCIYSANYLSSCAKWWSFTSKYYQISPTLSNWTRLNLYRTDFFQLSSSLVNKPETNIIIRNQFLISNAFNIVLLLTLFTRCFHSPTSFESMTEIPNFLIFEPIYVDCFCHFNVKLNW